MCPEIESNKWLMGTDELTLLDIFCGGMFDAAYVQAKAPHFADGATRTGLLDKAPKWLAYTERLRSHPKIAPVCMSQEIANKHAERARGWPLEDKCQLSIDIIKGSLPDCP